MLGRKIVLGTANFGVSYGIFKSKISKESNVKEILEFCQRNNIDTLDTSIDYLKAEEIIGASGCNNFNIVTKLPKLDQHNIKSAKKLEKTIFNSISKIKKNNLYALLFRDPKSILELNHIDVWKHAKNLKKKGIIKKLGISIYNPKS